MKINDRTEFVVLLGQNSKGGIRNIPADTLNIRCVNGVLWFHAEGRQSPHSFDHFDRVCVNPEALVWSCFFNGSHDILTCTCGYAEDAGFASQYCYCLNGDIYWLIETTQDDGIFIFRYEYEAYKRAIQTVISELYAYYKAGNDMVCESGEEIDWYPEVDELRELCEAFDSSYDLYLQYRKDRLRVWKIALKYGCTQEECDNIVSLLGMSCAKNEHEEHPTLYLVMGLPSSGKTTFCQDKYNLRDAISLDAVKTRSNEQILINDALSEHISYAIDNTNVSRAERAKYIVQAKEHGYRVEGYYLQSVVSDCLQRNAKRQGKARVPDVAILAKAKQLELPSYDEGFDQLWYVTIENGEFIEQDWKENE